MKNTTMAAFIVSMTMTAQAFADPAVPAPAASRAAPAASPQVSSKDQQQVQADRKAEEAMRFDDHKKEMLKSLSDRISEYQNRIAEMQKTEDCIKAASDARAMHACFPDNGRGWHHGDGKWEHYDHDGGHAGPAPQPPATQR